jgi:hypothetical protein
MEGIMKPGQGRAWPWRLLAAAALVAAAMTVVVVAQNTTSNGQQIFRDDTFGDEQLWTGVLRMHEVVAMLSPRMALSVGLKVDVERLPQNVIDDLRNNRVNLDDPAVTRLLLRANAVVGVRGSFSQSGQLDSIGVTCALCHSTVDDSLTKGIGRRLDGWAATDLNVGAIVALSPALDTATKAEFNKWGPGKYDPRHHYFNGDRIVPLNSPSLPVVIPPIYGLRSVEFETYTADGPISYWNRYVGVGQMGGQGTFVDQRIDLEIHQTPDLVAPKLPALLDYQRGLRTPSPPQGSFEPSAAGRGRGIFNRECASCHRPPDFTDVGSRSQPVLHAPAETGMEPEYASRSATGQYRTTPLRALWQHPPYFHDGSARDLPAVVEHYNRVLGLNLNANQKFDLVQFLKSL